MVNESKGKMNTDVRADKEERKASIFDGITTLAEKGYKFFSRDGKGNYVAKGERTKLKGRGWNKRGNKNHAKESKGTEDTELSSKESIKKRASFEKMKCQYNKIMNGIRTISKLKHARSEVFQETFNEIAIFKNMINENSEQLNEENRIEQAHSLLESVEKAEEIIQRYYLNGLGDFDCEIERRAIAAEKNRRAAKELRKRNNEYSTNNIGSSSHSTRIAYSNRNQDPADDSENR